MLLALTTISNFNRFWPRVFTRIKHNKWQSQLSHLNISHNTTIGGVEQINFGNPDSDAKPFLEYKQFVGDTARAVVDGDVE